MSGFKFLGPCSEFEGVAGSALASGDVVFDASGRAGVITVLSGVAAGQRYRASAEGRYSVPAATGTTFSANAIVYWNATTKLAQTTSAGDGVLGRSLKAKVSGELEVEVELNGKGPTA